MVFQLAAQIDVRRSVEDPLNDARNNVLGTINLLEASGQRKYRGSSTPPQVAPATVRRPPLPATETAVDPLSPYAAAKVAGELYMRAYAGMYGLAPICLALANVYGPRQDPHGKAGVVTVFGSAMISGRPTTIYGDGSATRDYVYVNDIVTAFLLLCAAEAPITTTGTFNIGTGVQTTVTELHQLIGEIAGVSRPPDHAEARTGEVQASALDPTLAGRVLGWKPDTDLTDGIKGTIDWLRGRLDPRPAASTPRPESAKRGPAASHATPADRPPAEPLPDGA